MPSNQSQRGSSDSSLLAALWVKALPNVTAYIMSSVNDANDTEDILQEVARVAVERFDEYDRTRPIMGWLLGFARMEILKYRRNGARDQLVFGDELIDSLQSRFQLPDECHERRHEALRSCIESLAPRKRTVLEMRYRRGLNAPKIAEQFGISVNSCAVMLHRIRQSLALCIARKLGMERLA